MKRAMIIMILSALFLGACQTQEPEATVTPEPVPTATAVPEEEPQ